MAESFLNDQILDDNHLETIIVTAERQKSDIQKTPLSVFAFTSDDIHNFSINQIPDLALRTPGLTIGNTGNASFPEIYIRGVGTRDFSIGSDLSIGFYINDVYIGRGASMFGELFDLERIEILKGPQGTLWGRNVVGGALHIITAKPSDEFTTEHQITLGNYDLFRIAGTFSGPLIDNRLLAKLSYSIKDREGFSNNLLNNRDISDAENVSVRGNLQYFPTDKLNFIFNVDFSADRPTAVAFNPVITGDPLLFGLAGNLIVSDPPFNHVEPEGPFNVNHDANTHEHRDIYGISGRLIWELEKFSLVSISALRGYDLDLLDDTDGISLQLLNFIQKTEQRQFSQEFRISNKDNELLTWLIGLYYFHEDTEDSITLTSQDLSLLLGPSNYSSTNFSKNITDSFSLFGHARYKFTEQISMTLGLRYIYEEKDFEIRRVSNDISGILDPSFPLTNLNDEWNSFTPKVGIEFQQTKDILYYASISRGYRSGGFNSLVTVLQEESFDPEFITAYEVGLKSNWYDRRLKINFSAFYYDHTDLQVTTLPAVGTFQVITTNAAESRDMGIEMEASISPSDNFQLEANIALLDTEFKKFINASGINVSGNNINHSPEFSSNLNMRYSFPIKDVGMVNIQMEHQYQSRIYFTETNENILSQDGYHNLNARVEFKFNMEKFSVALFGNNLTDKETANTGVDLRGELGIVNYSFNPPRTYGIEFKGKF